MNVRRRLWDYCPKPMKRTKSYFAKAGPTRRVAVLMTVALAMVLVCTIGVVLRPSGKVSSLSRNALSGELPIYIGRAGTLFNQGRTVALPLPEYFSIDLNLTNREISILRGHAQNIHVTIHGKAVANVTLSLETVENPDVTSLPVGIEAVFNPDSLQVEPNSTATVQLNMSVGNQATPRTYMLAVCGTSPTDLSGVGLGLTFSLIIK
jgi:hypothetical protein